MDWKSNEATFRKYSNDIFNKIFIPATNETAAERDNELKIRRNEVLKAFTENLHVLKVWRRIEYYITSLWVVSPLEMTV